jgi:SAM-dependent methyltransferase
MLVQRASHKVMGNQERGTQNWEPVREMEEQVYPHLYKIEKEHWWYAARLDILMHFLETRLDLSQPVRSLDVGCGTGAAMEMFSRKFQAFGLDPSPQAIAFCRQRGLSNLFHGELAGYPPGEPFDLITFLDVLEHVEDDRGTLATAHRLLDGKGKLLITVPAFPSLWSPLDVMLHHKRRYTPTGLKETVQSAGFSILHLTYFNTLLFPVALARRVAAKVTHTETMGDLEIPGKALNAVLKKIFELEKPLIPKVSFPFGLSLLCWAEKRTERPTAGREPS